MTQHRTAEQVKKFDIFKVVTFGILVLLLLLAYGCLRPRENPPAVAQATTEPTIAAVPATSEPVEATSQPAPATTAVEPAATVEPVATEEAAAPIEVTAPTLDQPGEVTAGEVTLTGSGEPGSEVEIVVDGKVVGKTTVGSDGKWSFAADLPNPGEYQVSVQSVDADGKILAASEAVALAVTAPAEAPVAAATEEVAEPAATPEATATEEAAVSTEMAAPTLDRPGEVTAGEVTLTGTGEPGSDVEIVVDGQVVGKTTVGRDGKWSLVADLSRAGDYKIGVQSVGEDGSALAAAEEISVEVTAAEESEAAAPEEEGGQAYIVQADDWLSKLALKFYSDMTKYPAIVEATNAKAQADSTFALITNPDLIEIGQKLWIPAEAP